MSKTTYYKEVTDSLLEIIEYSLGERATCLVLILLYSGIDTMAWLDRDEKHEAV